MTMIYEDGECICIMYRSYLDLSKAQTFCFCLINWNSWELSLEPLLDDNQLHGWNLLTVNILDAMISRVLSKGFENPRLKKKKDEKLEICRLNWEKSFTRLWCQGWTTTPMYIVNYFSVNYKEHPHIFYIYKTVHIFLEIQISSIHNTN